MGKICYAIAIFFLLIPYCYALDKKVSDKTNVVSEYRRLKDLYTSGKKNKAILQAQTYLKKNPKDGDVRLALGQFYFNEKKYNQARLELMRALIQTPTYIDVRLVLINTELALDQKKEALEIARQGLKLAPNNPDLLKKKRDIKTLLSAQTKPAKEKPILAPKIPEYKRLRWLYDSGRREQAILEAEAYLKQHPKDGDTRLILGQFYLTEKKYDQARETLTTALTQTPNYTDIRLALINTELSTQHYEKARELTEQGLMRTPQNKMLLEKQKQIQSFFQSNQQEWQKTFKPKHEIGLIQQNYYVSDLKKTWNYSTLYYLTDTPLGKVAGKINYADRIGHRGYQSEIEAYPIINKYLYLDLDVAFSRNHFLFPDQTYIAEGYFSVPKLLDFSIGGRYSKIDSEHFYRIYTGTLSKETEKVRITFRPYFFTPGQGPHSKMAILDLRYFIKNPHSFVGLMLGKGSSPDLADLQTINFIKLQNKLINFSLGFPLFKERLIIVLNASYQHQVFPDKHIRDITGGWLSVAWRI